MRRKKHPRLHNGLGSIKYLGSGRSNPYAVYPPEYRITDRGNMIYKRALCYVPDWYTGFAVLVSFNAGTYRPGDEIEIARKAAGAPAASLDLLSRKILADYRLIQGHEVAGPTFGDVWDEYEVFRFGEHAPRKFSEETRRQFQNCRRFFRHLDDRRISEVRLSDLQTIIDGMSEVYSKSYTKMAASFLSTVYHYALNHDYIKTDYSTRIVIPIIARESVKGEAFSREDLRIIWREANAGDQTAQSILVHCYSGFRVSAFYDRFVVDLDRMVFEGGVKTYRRQVPIIPEIAPFVHAPVWDCNKQGVNPRIRKFCEAHGMRPHTSHDCRHTFKSLLDRYDVAPIAQRLLMGHSAGSDVHDLVYTHYDLEDLRREISKIRVEM